MSYSGFFFNEVNSEFRYVPRLKIFRNERYELINTFTFNRVNINSTIMAICFRHWSIFVPVDK